MQLEHQRLVARVVLLVLVTALASEALSLSPPFLQATSQNGQFVVLRDWTTDQGGTVYSVHRSGSPDDSCDRRTGPVMWSFRWTQRNRTPLSLAVSDDGSTVVLTTMDGAYKPENRLEFWTQEGQYAAATFTPSEMREAIPSGVRVDQVSIQGDRVVVTNAIFDAKQRRLLGVPFYVERYWNAQRIELNVSDGSMVGSMALPDKTERSVRIFGKWRSYWLFLGSILGLGAACVLALFVFAEIRIKQMHNKASEDIGANAPNPQR